jgi:peptidoglycan/xylan/chitin deacetylase (PgdA/CDA1 family)
MAGLRHRLARGTSAAGDGEGRPMSQAAARSLRSAFVSLGGHGRNHVPLTALSAAARDEEIRGGMADVAGLCDGLRPSGFAYPHGDWDAETRTIVSQSGYRWAVTTNAARIDRQRYDLLALPRIQVRDWDGTALLGAIGAAAL